MGGSPARPATACVMTPAVAPTGVVRAAAWPLEALAGFGDPALATLPLDTPAFERAHADQLARERVTLWSRYLDDPELDRALCLASPSARIRVRAAARHRTGARNRAMRLAEHTLWRYLARAAGRATPNGLWAGVAPLAFGDRTEILPATRRLVLTPDLRPFQTMLRMLATRADYRDRGPWRANPTLCERGGGRWAFMRRGGDGTVDWCELTADGALEGVLATLARQPPCDLGTLAATLAGREVGALGARRAIRALLRDLAAAGVLVGGLDLATSFHSVWDALDISGRRLAGSERAAWSSATNRLRELCARLEDDLPALSPDEIAPRLEAPRAVLVELAGALGTAAPAPGERLLRCDLRLPWRLVLGTGTRAAIATALDEHRRHWLDAASPATATRRVARHAFRTAVAGGSGLLEAVARLSAVDHLPSARWPEPETVAEPCIAERLRRWRRVLESPHPTTTLEATAAGIGTPSPVGGAVIGLEADGALSVRAVSDVATAFSARLGDALDCTDMHHWVRARLDTWSARTGTAIAELRLPFEANPNAAAAPSLLDHGLAPWDSDPGLDLRDARLVAGPGPGAVRLRLAEDDRDWVVLGSGATAAQVRDPLARLLLWTGGHESSLRIEAPTAVPFADEPWSDAPTPAVHLPGGARLRSARWLVSEELSTLRSTRAVERFRHWQRLARHHRWPPMVEVAFDGGETLRTPRDSPLAVEALLKGVPAGCATMAVRPADPARGLHVPGVGHCVVELGVAFAEPTTTDPG